MMGVVAHVSLLPFRANIKLSGSREHVEFIIENKADKQGQ